MRALPFILVTLPLAALTACSGSGPVSVAGDAGPAGTPSIAASDAAITSSATPGSKPASARPSTPVPARASASPASRAPAAGKGPIRKTDWDNVTLSTLGPYGKVTFRNGKASSGAVNCTMLPGGARPYYAEFLTEEPANSPVTEDALILVECGSDVQQQMLIPVQVGYNQKTRQTVGYIKADVPTASGKRMTFTSYRVQGEVIVTTVRKTDGSRETRRYRFAGGDSWERV